MSLQKNRILIRLINQGLDLLKEDMVVEARKHFTFLLRQGYEISHLYLSECYFRYRTSEETHCLAMVKGHAGKLVEKERYHVEMALTLFPDNPDCWIRMAECYQDYDEEPEAALAAYKKAIELAPWDYRYHRALAEFYEIMGKKELAEKAMAEFNSLGGWELENDIWPID